MIIRYYIRAELNYVKHIKKKPKITSQIPLTNVKGGYILRPLYYLIRGSKGFDRVLEVGEASRRMMRQISIKYKR